MTLRFMLLASLIGSTAAAVAQPTPRQPTAKWIVNFDASQCIANRSYGTAEEPLHLVLKAPPIGNVMQIAVMRKGGTMAAEQVDASIGIDQQPPRKTSMLTFGSKNTKLRIYVLNMSSADFMQARQAKTLAIRSPGLNETFSLSQIEPLLRTMDRCVEDLRQVWNVSDPEGEQSLLAKRAKANDASFFKDEDYPAVSIRSDQSGAVRFALLIDEKGKVADCTVIETSGVAALDAQTCAIIKTRAKFEPAIGLDGKPAKDASVGTIRWAMAD